ncbi:GH92 family glycosyl hydrolase [Vagococcus lutrae]|uniref:GH92 family glycosyl hydrolase n=1 Tax=Vagococcus lutrae TaxID=81947 RepID=UPI00200C114C|nr:GH92 family glycosyl hydrolase [Vagococcus lutrae]MDT2816668.1 GH92 family glycosyl hydrolase [Vagococcus lutrae]UQF22777.1 GH92 family glycosyl hydrolase [Vagococcus lutrae]UQF63303.1 GH92 family glycosyl hydrolase [Vagococcus lutrae]
MIRTERDLLSIDTRQGTDNQYTFSNGNALPYTGVPFGMNYFVPQTAGERGSWFFNPNDRTFQGFRLTHQPSPWMGDFSSFVMTPTQSNVAEPTLFFHQSSYRPDQSVFAPHYLNITSLRHRIVSELVPTRYGAQLRMTYQQPKTAAWLLSLKGRYTFSLSDDGLALSGYVINYAGCEDPDFKMYVTFRFSTPATYLSTEGMFNEEDSEKTHSLLFGFASAVDNVTVSIGTSFLSSDQATRHALAIEGDSFESWRHAACQEWLDYLGRIHIDDQASADSRTFYGNLYRTGLFPQTFYERDEAGNDYHYDTMSRKVRPGKYFTNNGFWDTYKTLFPLYTIIASDYYDIMLEGFLNAYRETGYLPKWLSPDERGLMPGTLVDAVIADAAVKGIRLDLMPEFLEAMIKGATVQSEHEHYGRRGTEQYIELGYVSSDYGESVNHTQDYAYSDFCIARVAEQLGERAVMEKYDQQSLNYRHLFDAETGFMRPKTAAGEFVTSFNPLDWGKHYTEGSAWQNSLAMYHNFADMIEQMGGAEAFTNHLIALVQSSPDFNVGGYGFEIHEMSEMAAVDFGQLAMSNQPSFHIPYLFNYVNQPAYTQMLVKKIQDELFDSSWQGYPGDEDNGSMSAWYILSSLGFYPVCPGSGEYVVGVPRFEKMTVKIGIDRELVIRTTACPKTYPFVKGLRIDGVEVAPLAIRHEQLMTANEIEFEMSLIPPLPQEKWQKHLPYSLHKK